MTNPSLPQPETPAPRMGASRLAELGRQLVEFASFTGSETMHELADLCAECAALRSQLEEARRDLEWIERRRADGGFEVMLGGFVCFLDANGNRHICDTFREAIDEDRAAAPGTSDE